MKKILIVFLMLAAISNLYAKEVNYGACSPKITVGVNAGKYFYDDGVVKIYGIKPQKKIKFLNGLVSPSKKNLALTATILDRKNPQASMISIFKLVDGKPYNIKSLSFGHGVKAINFSEDEKKLYVIENFLYEISLTNFEIINLEDADFSLAQKINEKYFVDGSDPKCLK